MLKNINFHCRQQLGDVLMLNKTKRGLTDIIIFCEDSRSMIDVKLDNEQIKELINVLNDVIEKDID